jgi:hypothetical protein
VRRFDTKTGASLLPWTRYPSRAAAARAFDLSSSMVGDLLRGRKPHHAGVEVRRCEEVGDGHDDGAIASALGMRRGRASIPSLDDACAAAAEGELYERVDDAELGAAEADAPGGEAKLAALFAAHGDELKGALDEIAAALVQSAMSTSVSNACGGACSSARAEENDTMCAAVRRRAMGTVLQHYYSAFKPSSAYAAAKVASRHQLQGVDNDVNASKFDDDNDDHEDGEACVPSSAATTAEMLRARKRRQNSAVPEASKRPRLLSSPGGASTIVSSSVSGLTAMPSNEETTVGWSGSNVSTQKRQRATVGLGGQSTRVTRATAPQDDNRDHADESDDPSHRQLACSSAKLSATDVRLGLSVVRNFPGYGAYRGVVERACEDDDDHDDHEVCFDLVWSAIDDPEEARAVQGAPTSAADNGDARGWRDAKKSASLIAAKLNRMKCVAAPISNAAGKRKLRSLAS